MLKEMPSPLLTEWMAFSKLEPFGFLSDLLGFGIVSSVIANVNRRKGSKFFKPTDFLPEEKTYTLQSKSFVETLKEYFTLNKVKQNNGKKKK